MRLTIRDRIINILTAEGYNAASTFPERRILDAELPYIVVMPSRAIHTKRDSTTRITTLDVIVDVFLDRLGNDDTEFWSGYLDDGLAPQVEDLIQLFMTNPRLSLSGAPLASVRDAYLESDDYVGAAGWDDEVYAGTRLIVKVEYITSLR